MQIPFNMNRLKDTEIHYPQRFSNMLTRNYGLLFYNEGNKASQESNHAVILDLIEVESSLRDIEFFYKSKGIHPCLYPSLNPKELEILEPFLERHNYVLKLKQSDFFLHDHESSLRESEELKIERVRQLDIDIMETIAIDYGGDWTIKVVERHLTHPSYHFLGGYYQGELATMASVSIFAGYSRVDDVFTREKFRGKGFAGAMMHHLINYHRNISQNYLYLQSDLPSAVKIYEKAGFSRLPKDFQLWLAYKEHN